MRVTFVCRLEESIGIEYLSAVLKSAGHEVNIVYDPSIFNFNHKDFNIGPLARLLDIRSHLLTEVYKTRPDIVAFSVVSANYQWSVKFARQIKELSNVPVVFGGIHPSAVPERVLKNPEVDYVIRGEGEYPLLELANSLSDGRLDGSIKNLCYRKNGNVQINPLRPLIENLDSLPMPDKELFFRLGVPFNIGHMTIASRGCSHACTFCGNNIWRRIYFEGDYETNPAWLRWRSPDNVIGELKSAKERYGAKIVRFNDDDLAVNEKWLEEFSEKYRREINLPYKCFVMPPSINERTARYLRDSNCQQAQMGFQSINPEIRSRVLRPMSNETIARSIRLLRDNGIQVLTDNIFGFPWETEKDYWELVNFYRKNPVDFINIFWLIYFPRSDIVKQALEAGVLTEAMVNEMEEKPFGGCIQNRADSHRDIPVKFKMIFESMNYFPPWLSNIVILLRLYYLFAVFNIFLPIKVLGMIKPKRDDRFQKPTEGYELFSHRYSALVRHYLLKNLKIKLRGLFNRGTKIPLSARETNESAS